MLGGALTLSGCVLGWAGEGCCGHWPEAIHRAAIRCLLLFNLERSRTASLLSGEWVLSALNSLMSFS
jgi:hypothetical protein